jgi:hypothetical protein
MLVRCSTALSLTLLMLATQPQCSMCGNCLDTQLPADMVSLLTKGSQATTVPSYGMKVSVSDVAPTDIKANQ